jgi:hypothetical protein
MSASEFPTVGVKLSLMRRLAAELGEGGTTTDLCVRVSLVKTAEEKCSLAEYLRKIYPDEVGTATHFVSHAWSYTFADVVDALEAALPTLENKDPCFWFDCICVNQHTSATLSQEWWSTTFLGAIQRFNHTLFVLIPWNVSDRFC